MSGPVPHLRHGVRQGEYMDDVVDRAKQALGTHRAQQSIFYPRQLIEDLVAEVERLRSQ